MKTLRIALFSLIVTVSTATFGSVPSIKAEALSCTKGSEITADEITAYLIQTGHGMLSSPVSRDGGYTWTAITSMKGHTYLSTVYTDGVNIVGCEDTMID